LLPWMEQCEGHMYRDFACQLWQQPLLQL